MARSKPKRKPRSRTAEHQLGASRRERLIFRYSNGVQQVAADPLEIQFALMEAPDFEHNLKLSQVRNPLAAKDADAAFQSVVAAVRKAFNVPHLDPQTETGLTAAECMELLGEFGEFMVAVKKKLPAPPTTSSASESEPSAASSPTPSESASGSTESVCSPGEVSPSPSAPSSPSAAAPPETLPAS